MKIFITGIAGFIGFHLARFLAARGDFVIGCDNFNAYYDPELKKKRAQILFKEGIQVLDLDICDSSSIENVVSKNAITHLVHLAAQAGVRHSFKDPQSYVKTNLDGFVRVLEVCRKYPHMKLIYASSSSVYGLNEKTPFSEDDFTDKPASLYGATKKANEVIAHSYHHLYGISATGLRFFTVYGPFGRPDMAYYSFTRSIMEEIPIQVYNHGQMQRDFTYIDDIVRGTASAINLGAPFEIFNLGNNRPEELLDLIAIIEERVGKKAKIEFLPMQPGDVPITFADISKSASMLQFQPTISLKEGLERFVDWYVEERAFSHFS
jgi:UDP-glucuronate 4-epimerase